MNLEDFQKFIDEQSAFLRKMTGPDQTDRERVLVRTIKVSEEFGELCDEVLASIGDQRKGKMEGRDKESLSDEFADVVITTFLLAKAMDVDIMAALALKIPKIRAKHNKQLMESTEV